MNMNTFLFKAKKQISELGSRGQILSFPTLLLFTLVRLPDEKVANLGPAEPGHLLLQGESGEGAL